MKSCFFLRRMANNFDVVNTYNRSIILSTFGKKSITECIHLRMYVGMYILIKAVAGMNSSDQCKMISRVKPFSFA